MGNNKDLLKMHGLVALLLEEYILHVCCLFKANGSFPRFIQPHRQNFLLKLFNYFLLLCYKFHNVILKVLTISNILLDQLHLRFFTDLHSLCFLFVIIQDHLSAIFSPKSLLDWLIIDTCHKCLAVPYVNLFNYKNVPNTPTQKL